MTDSLKPQDQAIIEEGRFFNSWLGKNIKTSTAEAEQNFGNSPWFRNDHEKNQLDRLLLSANLL